MNILILQTSELLFLYPSSTSKHVYQRLIILTHPLLQRSHSLLPGNFLADSLLYEFDLKEVCMIVSFLHLGIGFKM